PSRARMKSATTTRVSLDRRESGSYAALFAATACDDCPHSDQPVHWRGRHGGSKARLVSVLVSFTPVRHRSPVVALIVFAQARTLADAGERWCAVLESV